MVPSLPLLAVLLLCAPALHAQGCLMIPDGTDAGVQAEAEPDNPRKARMREAQRRLRTTGSRVGFRYSYQPPVDMVPQIGTGERCDGRPVAVRSTVESRPTRWRPAHTGGRTVHRVRFGRDGNRGGQH